MQTFLTGSSWDFAQTAKVLDNKRLNKQALEAWQIMMTNLKVDPEGNHREPKGWYNHPATKMWRGYEYTLLEYIHAMTTEWVKRGYKTTILDKAMRTMGVEGVEYTIEDATSERPEWMLDRQLYTAITTSHRTALLCKNYDWYKQFKWAEDLGQQPDYYDYVWA